MPYPTPAGSVTRADGRARRHGPVEDGRLVIDDEPRFRDEGVRAAVWSATFSTEKDVIEAARWIIWEASQELGARSASIHELYMARGRGEVHGFTVPAVQPAHAGLRHGHRRCAARREPTDVGTMIFELARSEQEYTFQRPGEYITSVLAGCIAAGWQGPVFVQGDHYQFNAAKYKADPEATTEAIRKATRDAIAVGYGNIDIDSSTLVDLALPTSMSSSATNYERAAEISALIREVQPPDLMVSIGGEIGEVGKQNSTEEELRAYLDGYYRELERRAGPGVPGISKVSVQTGTSHGGVPLPDGGVAEVKLDFGTLERLGEVARSYGLAGAVQHGASTLPDELFHRFPAVETAEIHLATGFQNLLYEHPAFPKDLLTDIEAWCFTQHARRAQARRDRRAVHLQDAQEGARPVQAPAVGAADQGRDPGRPAEEAGVPVRAAQGQWHARNTCHVSLTRPSAINLRPSRSVAAGAAKG